MTVAAALTMAGLAALLIAIVYLGAGVLARHRAQNAADLGALAAASAHVRGDERPCARAREIADAQEGPPRVVRCEVDGQDLLIEVVVPVRLGQWGLRSATARARAGPTE
ncbi:flp pilus-assembly TadE/G-like family protein [Gordonia alkaliphila]|uniref:Putative Flp pilus-assembly TadG-like N-terminal domain-containing protein n=1 Tax=Gordonia alkaliphila TaxID=1053547 RepID=A0ABP8YZ98_9ACTN|nr:Rv3654c family TadE-like protein [Gordonia alkaliphila]MCK0439281.1 flp pilus-assembly TadE/G-like family protein [Gordonia alkaliphila]